MSRRGYRIREAYRNYMANQVNSDSSIGSSQRSNPFSSSTTDGSGEWFLDERFLDNQSDTNIIPSYQENTNMVNHPSARPNAFPNPRQSSPEMDDSIVVALPARIENGQSSGLRSHIHADGNSEAHLISISYDIAEMGARQEAQIRALVEHIHADGTQEFEELVVEQEQDWDVDIGLTEEEIVDCIGYETFDSVGEETLANKDACSICQEDYVNGNEVGRLDCAHKFHIECIKQWLVLNNICPICRRMALMPIDELMDIDADDDE